MENILVSFSRILNVLQCYGNVLEILKSMKLQVDFTEVEDERFVAVRFHNCSESIEQYDDVVVLTSTAAALQLTEGDLFDNLPASLCSNKITLVITDLKEYQRKQKTEDKRKFQRLARGANDDGARFTPDISIERFTRLTLLHYGRVNVKYVDMKDLPKFILSFVKALSKKELSASRLDAKFSFYAEKSGVKLNRKDPSTFRTAWRQQLQTFKGVSQVQAIAIASDWKTPRSLWEEYSVTSPETAAKLLQDIKVRRGGGILETSQRIGPETSRKIYDFFSSRNPNDLHNQ